MTRRSWVSLADEPTFAFTDPSFSRMKDSGVDWLTRESRVVIGRAPARSKNPTWRRFPAALPSSLGCGAHGVGDDICFDTSPAGVGSRARRTAHGAASGGDPGRGIVGSNRRGVDARVRRRGLRSEARAGSRARGRDRRGGGWTIVAGGVVVAGIRVGVTAGVPMSSSAATLAMGAGPPRPLGRCRDAPRPPRRASAAAPRSRPRRPAARSRSRAPGRGTARARPGRRTTAGRASPRTRLPRRSRALARGEPRARRPAPSPTPSGRTARTRGGTTTRTRGEQDPDVPPTTASSTRRRRRPRAIGPPRPETPSPRVPTRAPRTRRGRRISRARRVPVPVPARVVVVVVVAVLPPRRRRRRRTPPPERTPPPPERTPPPPERTPPPPPPPTHLRMMTLASWW